MNQPEDHMDELFRKAGELYPLKTDGQDWDKVLAALEQQPAGGSPPPVAARKKFLSWRWLALLLLIPVGWLTWKYSGSPTQHNEKTTVVSASSTPGKAMSAAASPAGAHSSPVTAGSSNAPAEAKATGTIDASVATAGPHAQSSNAPARSAGADRDVFHANRSNQSPARNRVTTAVSAATVAYLGNTPADQTANGQQASPAPAASQSQLSAFEWAPDALAATNARHTPGDLPPATPAASQYPAGPQKPAVTNLPKTKTRVSGFYAGVLGGPDFSTVKFQEWQNPGYSIGLLAGYRFNKSLAVEAGALWDRKVYYTSGQYFNKTKAGIPATWQVNDMDGNCNMFEIPVSIRWDFLALKKGGLFATAGLSSYMMKQENYTYSATYNSSTWQESKSYANSGNDFLSIMHLSAGYTFPWGRVGDLRLEPYWKIPLKGVGIGDLPMSSLGLYVGLTHFFR